MIVYNLNKIFYDLKLSLYDFFSFDFFPTEVVAGFYFNFHFVEIPYVMGRNG